MNTPALQIDGIIIPVSPNSEHEYTLTTAQVADGYAVAEKTVQNHKLNHQDELVEGKHFLVSQNMGHGNLRGVTHWTKRGIIRLGFFIKSERAKRFRDMAEDLILDRLDHSVGGDTLPFCPVIDLGEKMRAHRIASGQDLVLYRAMAQVRDELAATKTETPPASPRAEGEFVDWVRSLAAIQTAAGALERTYSVPDLLAKEPPLPKTVANPGVALGQRLGQLAGTPISLPTGEQAALTRVRTRHTRLWLLRVEGNM
jgi:hypothetical protein